MFPQGHAVEPDSTRHRIVKEILGDVEVWEEGEGPNGPWEFGLLTVEREHNMVHIFDCDGRFVERLHVSEIVDRNKHEGDALRGILERLNDRVEEQL